MDRRVVIDSQALKRYLQFASISIASYDYVITLPAEWRFYRSQSSIFSSQYRSHAQQFHQLHPRNVSILLYCGTYLQSFTNYGIASHPRCQV
ncbi:hypothetical protein EV702DRAFT_1079517 [Suillus placidus]|uniref:DUF6533 domain-containing protein n=1 Tax=Suillus placidus TaxID=48579 RepID=A0A9P7A1B0_9AGAM|nr:hypothetical protein EV702DRAFT_1079517 [Suillus placidus]